MVSYLIRLATGWTLIYGQCMQNHPGYARSRVERAARQNVGGNEESGGGQKRRKIIRPRLHLSPAPTSQATFKTYR